MMLELIERIRERLAQGAYVNEAAISHGVVTPILNALGWDSADPDQLVPEFALPRGRVDFALFALGHRPGVFIEVKGIGRAMDGDRQLFEYAFHQGVPLCVLTDGREWSFYVPGGQGSYDDRRVYRLQLDDRDPEECRRILLRYLARDRVRDGSAFEDAQRDYRDAAGKREAVTALPKAWRQLVAEPDDLLLEIVGGKAEAICGFKPDPADVIAFLRGFMPAALPLSPRRRTSSAKDGRQVHDEEGSLTPAGHPKPVDRSVSFTIFGQQRSAPTAAMALVEILKTINHERPEALPALATAVRGRSRSLIARSAEEINPKRSDLARATDIGSGWLVGLNISNREKMAIIRTAADIAGLRIPEDLQITLPNG